MATSTSAWVEQLDTPMQEEELNLALRFVQYTFEGIFEQHQFEEEKHILFLLSVLAFTSVCRKAVHAA